MSSPSWKTHLNCRYLQILCIVRNAKQIKNTSGQKGWLVTVSGHRNDTFHLQWQVNAKQMLTTVQTIYIYCIYSDWIVTCLKLWLGQGITSGKTRAVTMGNNVTSDSQVMEQAESHSQRILFHHSTEEIRFWC